MADRYPHEYDDDPLMDEEDDLMEECGFIPGEGICMKAGTEWCDWSCPFNPRDPIGL
jgi:hypothetical protein